MDKCCSNYIAGIDKGKVYQEPAEAIWFLTRYGRSGISAQGCSVAEINPLKPRADSGRSFLQQFLFVLKTARKGLSVLPPVVKMLSLVN